jgi:hypothetical protein
LFLQTAKRIAAPDCVSNPVVEGTNMKAADIQLGGILSSSILLYFAKIPPRTLDKDFRAINAGEIQRQAVQRRSYSPQILHPLVAQQVKSKTK